MAEKESPLLPPLPADVRDRLDSVYEILFRQIKDSKTTPTDTTPTCGVDFHCGLLSASQLVSTGCTKIAVLFSKLPCPSLTECGVLCQQLEQATLQLVSTLYQNSPDHHGKTLQLEARACVLNILITVKKFVELFAREGCSLNPSKLQGSGTVWDSCDTISRLSRDNKSAVSKVCLAQLQLLGDAWDEVKELQSRRGEDCDDMKEFGSDGTGDGGICEVKDRLEMVTLEEGCGGGCCWSDADVKTVDPCISMVQAVVDFTKFTCHQLVTCGDISSIAKLDHIADGAGLLSPLVDDLVSELPAPINTSHISKLGMALGQHLLQFIDAVDSSQFSHHSNSSHSNSGIPVVSPEFFRDIVHNALSKLNEM